MSCAQSRTGSLIETVTSVAVGFVLTMILQAIMYPLFGIHTTLATNLWLTVIFTVASIVRGYVLRRIFERLHNRSALHDTASTPTGGRLHRTDGCQGVARQRQ